MSAQSTQLKRVNSRIGECVLEFCRLYAGKDFHASDLSTWVSNRVNRVAPGSADRILRHLRSMGIVSYTVVSRGGSFYHIDSVDGTQYEPFKPNARVCLERIAANVQAA